MIVRINVRQKRMGIQEWTIQRHGNILHKRHGTKTKKPNKTVNGKKKSQDK